MTTADVAISGGGQTIHELACIGVPTLAICMASSQKNNVYAWAQTGFLDCCMLDDSVDLAINVENFLINNEEYDVREKKVNIGRNIIDGRGACNIVDEVMCYEKNN